MATDMCSGLIGSPINAVLLPPFSYLGLSLFSGLAMFIGMFLLMVARYRISPKLIAKA